MTNSRKTELKDSADLEKLVDNPIKENEAGQIEGGFAEAAIDDEMNDKDKDTIKINFYMCN